MPSIAHGTSAIILLGLALTGLLLVAGCTGTGMTGSSPAGSSGPIPATVPPTTGIPSPVPTTGVPDLSLHPPTAAPVQGPPVDPIVGKWYAPVPDDLTFEFFADGTFRETSPGFKPYYGTWGISEEREEGFYDALILDQWGYKKQVHILLSSGTLTIKSMGTLHRIG